MSSSEETRPSRLTVNLDEFERLIAQLDEIKVTSSRDVALAENEQRVLKSAEFDEYENKMLGPRIDRYRLKTDLIKEYAQKLFWFMVVWSIMIFYILLLSGLTWKHESLWGFALGFDLPEKVLITLVGATTIQVIGLFASVAYYLYRSDKD